MTKQRATILDVIREEKRHYTAEEIFTKAKERLPGMSRATVYNNLHALEKERFIRRITGEEGSDRYDSSYVPHGHLFCTECGEICDFNIPNFDDSLSGVVGTEIDSYELKVRCVCEKCRRTAEESYNKAN